MFLGLGKWCERRLLYVIRYGMVTMGTEVGGYFRRRNAGWLSLVGRARGEGVEEGGSITLAL